MIKVKKDEKEYTVAVNENIDADILFQNIHENKELFNASYDYVVCAIPFCDDSFMLRQHSYRFKNHYGVDKFFLMDSEPDGYLAHRNNKLPLHKICSTEMLITQWFTSQGYEIL